MLACLFTPGLDEGRPGPLGRFVGVTKGLQIFRNPKALERSLSSQRNKDGGTVMLRDVCESVRLPQPLGAERNSFTKRNVLMMCISSRHHVCEGEYLLFLKIRVVLL